MAREQYIVFRLNEDEYGIGIMNIREIITYKESTKIPDTPDFIEGVLNHRDTVVPIINLKERLKVGKYEVTNDSRIIILTIHGKDVGFLVDGATQTLMLESEDVEDSPTYASDIDRKYIKGVAKLPEDELLIIMDLEGILSYREINQLNEIDKKA